ncbi:MAG: hypothetical protein KDG57_10865 [Rhodoferax sp.]|nr:hypothetical protein [Rhodoferax sp.]
MAAAEAGAFDGGQGPVRAPPQVDQDRLAARQAQGANVGLPGQWDLCQGYPAGQKFTGQPLGQGTVVARQRDGVRDRVARARRGTQAVRRGLGGEGFEIDHRLRMVDASMRPT